MNSVFVEACKQEIRNNQEKKGPWEHWKPTRKEVLTELGWHIAKLNNAVINNDHESTKEFSADVANICEKIHHMATIHRGQRKAVYDLYGDFLGYDGDWREE